uniref:Uncharacterized protein n=1 Tax=Oryza sativa subsp. japonica TaxID=39947 RepID=Q6Z448_ORYSJ|nr:hypothetical protein [Oryza sativa Japonica Group]
MEPPPPSPPRQRLVATALPSSGQIWEGGRGGKSEIERGERGAGGREVREGVMGNRIYGWEESYSVKIESLLYREGSDISESYMGNN